MKTTGPFLIESGENIWNTVRMYPSEVFTWNLSASRPWFWASYSKVSFQSSFGSGFSDFSSFKALASGTWVPSSYK